MSVVIVRRIKKNKVKSDPILKVSVSKASFALSYKATEILDVSVGDGLMFSFNNSTQIARVWKDSEEGNYSLNKVSGRNILRFSDSVLLKYLLECYALDRHGVHSFTIIDTKNKDPQKRFELHYKA